MDHFVRFGSTIGVIVLMALVMGLPLFAAAIYGSSATGSQPVGTFARIERVRVTIVVVGYGTYLLAALWMTS